MGLFLPYQERWVLDRSPVKVGEKSRRVGFTWCTAYEAVEVAAADASCGGSNFWYQTYAEDDAKEFIEDAGKFAMGCSQVFDVETEELSEDESQEYFLLPDGTRSIKITSIRFRSGHRIVALPHSPRKLRGKGGVYCLDEAAFHDDMAAAMKAAQAFRMWGGRVIIMSTHNGVESPFNLLIEDIHAGRKDYSLHRVTLHDAVREGLYKRICLVRGVEWTPESEEAWVAELLETEGAEEEFLCIPVRSGGQYLPAALIEPCMYGPDNRIARLTKSDDFLGLPEAEREEFMDVWCERHIRPILWEMDPKLPSFLGVDFGRSSDLSVKCLGQLTQELSLDVVLQVELGNIPFEQQKQVFRFLMDESPRMQMAALDATGNGVYLGEYGVGHYGETKVEAVKITLPWYAENFPPLRARFQDRTIRILRDLDARQDLGMVEVVDGVPRLPKKRIAAQREDRFKGEKRHGDTAVALAMLNYAAKRPALAVKGYERTGKRGGDFAYKGMW